MLNADICEGGEEVDQMRTPADRGRGRKMGRFLVDVLYGRPLNKKSGTLSQKPKS